MQTFFEMVSIFELMRDEAKIFRETFSGACAQQKIYIRYRQTDRQTNSLTPYTGMGVFFLQVKFATSLLASLAGDKLKLRHILVVFA